MHLLYSSDIAKGMSLKCCVKSYTFIKITFRKQGELSFMVVVARINETEKIIRQFSFACKEMLVTNYNVVAR